MQLATVKVFIEFVPPNSNVSEMYSEEVDVLIDNDVTEEQLFDKLEFGGGLMSDSDLFAALGLRAKYGADTDFTLMKIEITARAPRRLISIDSDGIYDDANTSFAEEGSDFDSDEDDDSDEDAGSGNYRYHSSDSDEGSNSDSDSD